MSPIRRRMKKRNPSGGQNGQLVHWWLLFHSGPENLPFYVSALYIVYGHLVGQSEPAPTSAPVPHSVDRMGWAAFLHPVPDLVLTDIVPQSTFFGRLPLTYSFWVLERGAAGRG